MRSFRAELIAALCILWVACSGETRTSPPAVARDAQSADRTAAVALAPDAAPVVGPRDPLLGQIPNDTPFAFIERDHSGFGRSPTDALLELRAIVKPWVGAFIPDDATAQMDEPARLGFAAFRLFLELDAATLHRIGFGDPKRQIVIYGLGLVPVLRLEVDGALLRERFAAEATRAGVAKPFADWHGRPYIAWSLGGGAAELVVMVRDDQLAIAIARRAADILPHLAGEAPPAVALDDATLLRASGLTGALSVWIDPSRAAALVGGSGAGALPSLTDAPAGCGAALAPVIAGLPAVVAASTASSDHVEMHMRIGPVPTFAGTLRPLAHPIAHWPTDPPGRGIAYYGLGASPLPFVEALAGFVDTMGPAGAACGGEPTAGPSKLLLVKLLGVRFLALQGGTAIVDMRNPRANAPPSVVLVAEVTDPDRIYSAIAGGLGLPLSPPRLDKPRAFKQDGTRGSLTLHHDAISAWIGRADAKALAMLRAAPPGDAAFVRASWTSATAGSGTWSTRITLDGDHLVVDHTVSR